MMRDDPNETKVDDEHTVDKAEGQRDPDAIVTKVSRTPGQAEGERQDSETPHDEDGIPIAEDGQPKFGSD